MYMKNYIYECWLYQKCCLYIGLACDFSPDKKRPHNRRKLCLSSEKEFISSRDNKEEYPDSLIFWTTQNIKSEWR